MWRTRPARKRTPARVLPTLQAPRAAGNRRWLPRLSAGLAAPWCNGVCVLVCAGLYSKVVERSRWLPNCRTIPRTIRFPLFGKLADYSLSMAPAVSSARASCAYSSRTGGSAPVQQVRGRDTEDRRKGPYLTHRWVGYRPVLIPSTSSSVSPPVLMRTTSAFL